MTTTARSGPRTSSRHWHAESLQFEFRAKVSKKKGEREKDAIQREVSKYKDPKDAKKEKARTVPIQHHLILDSKTS